MNKVKKKNKKIRTEKLVTSLLVILLYFLWPFFIAFVKDLFNINENDLVFGLVCNALFILVLIFVYRNDLKKYALEFNKNINILNINQMTANDSSLFASFKLYPMLIGFLTIVYYPIVEEIVFEKTIKDVINSRWLFVILSALFFWYYNIAYTGGINFITIISSLYYFVLGFIRAMAFYKTDNLYVPVFIKAIYNAFVTIIS